MPPRNSSTQPTQQPTTSPIDLQAVTTELRQKMAELDRFKAAKARYEGALEQVTQQLRNDHNVETLEQAEALLQRRLRIEARTLRSLEAKLAELRAIEERINDARRHYQDNIPF